MYTLNNKPVLEENDQVIIEWEHLRYPDKEVQDFIDANGYHDETLFTVIKFDNESGLVWLKEIPHKAIEPHNIIFKHADDSKWYRLAYKYALLPNA